MSLKSSSCGFPKIPPNALIYILDDEQSIRESLARLFRSERLAIETFASAKDFLNRAKHDGPTCLILDLQLPDLHGLKLQQMLVDRQIQIVFLTGCGDIPMCAEAMKAGAIDFLIKPVDGQDLINAVIRALQRSTEVRSSAIDRTAARTLLNTLTPREFEVMRWIIAGLLNKQIAYQLGTAEKTIKIHRGRVMKKMRVSSVPELVRRAQTAGVTPVGTNTQNTGLISFSN